MFLVKSMSTWVSLAERLTKDNAHSEQAETKSQRAKDARDRSEKSPSKH
jgi:hypothetical protein